jgi:hypothetical protein
MAIETLDPALALSFAMHANRGVYAALLGSGVSRAAAIPTGWEIVLDLIQKLAALLGEDCKPTPEEWYEQRFGEQPTYSFLLKKLARSQAERQQLLRGYFEASPEDEALGAKQPTKAHRALAALVKSGHVRVIVTTNFDRLVERSLDAEGVNPIVVSTPSAVDGALPLTHASCTVVKLHGDYLDMRIKNTPDELAKYDRRIDRLLDRIMDEFGLIVCGWSAEWDEALRTAFERCKSRRFSTYWTTHGAPSDAAERLIRHRLAEVIPIPDADQFFLDLQQKLVSLASFDPPHPLSSKTAVATMKRLLVDDRHRIELHDLVKGELQRVIAATTDDRMPVSGTVPINKLEVGKRLKQYDTLSSILCDLLITGCYWGDEPQYELWTGALERLANRPLTGGVINWTKLRLYPALRALYAGGIAATLRCKYKTLRALLMNPTIRDNETERPLVERIYPQALLEQAHAWILLEGMDRRHTPVNDYLFDSLRASFRDLLPDDRDYEDAFDRFEYFVSLVKAQSDSWIPVGRFAWKGPLHRGSEVIGRLSSEAASAGADWAPIRSGLFTSRESFKAAETAVGAAVSQRNWW